MSPERCPRARPQCHRGPRSPRGVADRKSTRLNPSHLVISYVVFCLNKKTNYPIWTRTVRTVSREFNRGLSEISHRKLLADAFFFFNDTAPTEIYPLSLHDAIPI